MVYERLQETLSYSLQKSEAIELNLKLLCYPRCDKLSEVSGVPLRVRVCMLVHACVMSGCSLQKRRQAEPDVALLSNCQR